MIEVVDISEWQGDLPADWFGQWGGVIVRVHSGRSHDNRFKDNMLKAHDAGVPLGVYGYMVPDRDRRWQAEQAADLARGVDVPIDLGFWCDAEELYDETSSILTYTNRWMQLEVHEEIGYYSNDWRVQHNDLLHLPFWLAAYPAPNDGVWRANEPRAGRPINLWQWTSSSGTLDKNAVWDEPWFNTLVEGGSMPTSEEIAAAVVDAIFTDHELPSVFALHMLKYHDDLVAPIKDFAGKTSKLLDWTELQHLATQTKITDLLKESVHEAMVGVDDADADEVADLFIKKLSQALTV